ncbi:hypothetical protein TrVE_jg5874 [Triparma verrucosa]|uniref:Uncharacterized protein n=1 Tax=Triparma verrucosa TaxID=1606542 RepID=A0A9W7FEZ5_9STRA|nr:hypothetical protein TrVE_jg5874 [Triparma verrucosa]
MSNQGQPVYATGRGSGHSPGRGGYRGRGGRGGRGRGGRGRGYSPAKSAPVQQQQQAQNEQVFLGVSASPNNANGSGNGGRGNNKKGRSTFNKLQSVVKKVAVGKAFSKKDKSGNGFVERDEPPPKPVMLEHGEPVLNVDIDVGGGKNGKITVKVGDDPFSLALDFCVSFELVKNPPPVENGIPVVSNIAAFEAENRHVKTVKNHILKFVDVETSKKKTGKGGSKPAGKSVVGKRGCMKQLEEYERWQKKAAMGTAKKIPEAQASEAPVDPFSVSPRIPENKRMASVGSATLEQQAALQPTVKKGRYDSPVSGKERANSGSSLKGAAKTPVKDAKPTPVAKSANKKEPRSAAKPKATPKAAPTPSSPPPPPKEKNDEGGSNMLVLGGVAAVVVGIAFMFLKKKK